MNNSQNPEIFKLLDTVTNCEDTPFRKNLTFLIVANRIQGAHFVDRQLRVWNTFRWITGYFLYHSLTGSKIKQILQIQYFLVGLTERLSEFLVLLALIHGWDPKVLYYRKCKPTNFDLNAEQFTKYFPHLVNKLKSAMVAANEAYDWAKAEYESHIKTLDPWFPTMVSEFEQGLREYQKKERAPGSYDWKDIMYRDGQSEYC